MDITLLGTGNPQPNLRRAGPSNHLAIADQSVLLDCGSGTVHQLLKAGRDAKDIDYLFLTHMHSDHTVDIAHVLITGWIRYRDKPIHIVGPPQTKEFVARVLHAFEFDLRLRRLDDRVGKDIMTVEVTEVSDGDTFEADGWKATAVEVEHGYVKPALGFIFDDGMAKIMVSGDTTGCDAIREASRGVDLLVHELMRDSESGDPHDDKLAAVPELRRRIIESHTCPHQLGPIARDADVPRLALTHMSAATDDAWVREILASDYKGEIIMGEDLTTITV
jgi:ribonuclease Z